MRHATLVIALSVVSASGLWAKDETLPRFSDSGSAPRTYAAASLEALLTEMPEPEATEQDKDKDKDKDKDRHEGHRHADGAEFSIGPMGGYLRARDADRGTWFGGVQARLRFLRVLAVEGSISFHQNYYSDGDVVVTQFPVQVTALILPFPNGPVDPYLLGGVGWYYTRTDIDEDIAGEDEHETDNLFGFHVGAGLNLWLSDRFSLFCDFRWVFLDRPNVDDGNIRDQEYDYWQVTFGMNFRF
jgi:opacity protein-like surface antigen